VRRLHAEEEGLPLSELPFGVFGFTVPWVLEVSPARPVVRADEMTLHPSPGGTGVLEVHRLENGTAAAVGFVSPDEAVKLGNPSRTDPIDLTIYLTPSQMKPIPVAIPTEQLIVTRHRSVGYTYVLDARIGPPARP
jgi:hypothetical protein